MAVIIPGALRRYRFVAIVVATVGLFAARAPRSVLFFDDFTGSTLNSSNWGVGTWQLGRSQLGNTPTVAGGIASLRMDTYNPANTTLLRGTEIDSRQLFSPGTSGIDIEARVRIN